MLQPIFLSAGVPDLVKFRNPKRPRRFEEHYILQAKRQRVRDAVLALVAVAADQGRQIVFGGQPGITPAVDAAAVSMGRKQQIHIYQSEFFKKFYLKIVTTFANLHEIPEGPDEAASLELMRREMLSPNRYNFSHGVFIGGMNGVFDELALFKNAHPDAKVLPVASTGGAAAALWDRNEGFPAARVDLRYDLRYRRMYRKYLV